MMMQITLFGFVGLSAMLTHWLLVSWLVPMSWPPLQANVLAFLIAFQVSYWGHRTWTFQAHKTSHRKTLPRFFATALSSFALNEGLYFVLLRFTQLNYQVALAIVLVSVAFITFVLSKYWAFKHV